MCAVTSIVDRSVRSIESIDGRYGGCWRRSSPKPPSHKPRRRLNSSSTPGPVDCARAVWRETLSWVPFGAAPPQVTRLSPPTSPSKPPRSSSPGTTMLGQSPLTRAHCGGGGARSLARSRALVIVAVESAFGYTARHARYARRASRARTRTSSPRIARVITVSLPPPRTHARAARRRRSLARSIARVRCGCGDGGLAVGHAARHTHHALRASRARTCASSTGDTRVITVPFPPRARTPALQRKRRSLAPSIARARCGGKRHPGCLSVPLPPKSPDSPPLTIPSKPSRSSSPGTTMLGQSPLTRAHCGGGGARSLARSRARCVAVAVEVAGGYIARHARYARRASRACTRTSSPRIARVIAVFRSPRARPARARCSGGGARAPKIVTCFGLESSMCFVDHDARHTHRSPEYSAAKSCTRVKFFGLSSVALYTGHATCARALELELGRPFERRAVLSGSTEAEQRDGQVRFSVRPCLPSWDWAYVPVIRRPPSVPVEYPD